MRGGGNYDFKNEAYLVKLMTKGEGGSKLSEIFSEVIDGRLLTKMYYLIAWEERHIHGARFDSRRILVHYSIHLCMTYVHVFRFRFVFIFFSPW